MIPAHGLVPPRLSIKDLNRNEFSHTRQYNINAFPATRKKMQDVTSVTQKVIVQLRMQI